MTKVQVTRQELLERLREQVGFLEASAKAFDEGNPAEAKRLAVTVRILAYDTPKSHSLLAQLQLQDRLQFYEIADVDLPGNMAAYHGLVGLRVSNGAARYFAYLDDWSPAPVRKSAFKEWWTRYVIRDHEGAKFTRKDLVLALANKEGGAHVDPELDKEYARLSRANSLRWYFSVGGEERDWSKDPVPHSVRHVAHEVLTTLHEQVPDAAAEKPHGYGWRLGGLP